MNRRAFLPMLACLPGLAFLKPVQAKPDLPVLKFLDGNNIDPSILKGARAERTSNNGYCTEWKIEKLVWLDQSNTIYTRHCGVLHLIGWGTAAVDVAFYGEVMLTAHFVTYKEGDLGHAPRLYISKTKNSIVLQPHSPCFIGNKELRAVCEAAIK